MYLLVGLGNVGKEYEMTRHNFGFLLLDKIIEGHNFNFAFKKFKSEVFTGQINQKKIIAIKPQTFMNRSGRAVMEVANFYKIELKNIIVLHDEVDLEFGKIRVKLGGGSAGHNGLKSIDEMLGKDYLRVRLGVGKSKIPQIDVADHVLGRFEKEEILLVEEINKKISSLFSLLLEGRADEFVNKFYL